MNAWCRVKFQRESVVQSVEIRNEDSSKMQNFYIRVGNDESFTVMNTLALCAGPLTWTPPTINTYTSNAAVRGQYMYIINGDNGPVVLIEVKTRGYLQPATETCVKCVAGSHRAMRSCTIYLISHLFTFVYYESIKRELKIRFLCFQT